MAVVAAENTHAAHTHTPIYRYPLSPPTPVVDIVVCARKSPHVVVVVIGHGYYDVAQPTTTN
jgi:hypothetical protein